jgi:hypothetical protein
MSEHEETWIEELQRSFGDAMEKEVSYFQSKEAAGKKAMDEERLQETTKKDSGVTTMGSDRANPGAPNHNGPNGGPQAQAVEQKHWPGPLICHNVVF